MSRAIKAIIEKVAPVKTRCHAGVRETADGELAERV
jgi:hypothetical protein